jgi:DNA-binding CsgD family transcriptional regulator/PAS domain-containing protein
MEAFSNLVGRIYDAAIDPGQWEAVLGEASVFTNAERAILIHEDAVQPSRSLFYISNPDPEWDRLYLETYLLINPARLALVSRVRPGDIVLTTDYMSKREYLRTRFAQEFLSRRNFIDVATAVLEMTATSITVLGIVRSEAQGFADAAVRRKLGWIAPHFRRALAIGSLFEQRRMEARVLADTLDGLTAPVFILARDGGIVHANGSAQDLVMNEATFRVSDGKLIPRDPASRAALAEALVAAAGGDEALGAKDLSILFRTNGGRAFLGVLMALTDGARRPAAERYHAVAALCLREVSGDAVVVPPAIAELYGLTRREMTVFATIVENAGVPETAAILGLAEGTVKSHLKSIFRKTGARAQADLVKLAAGVASPFG